MQQQLGGSGASVPAGPLGFRESLRSLAAVQKSGKGAPAYSRFVNRRFGRVLAAAANVLKLTPNSVTIVSAIFTFSAIGTLALATPSLGTGIAVALLLVVGYALDAADGQLARLQGRSSVSGEWLDHIVDCFKISSLHLAVLVQWYRFWDIDDEWLLVPIGFAVVGATSFFAQILNEQLRRNRGGDDAPTDRGAAPSVLMSMAKVPTDFGLLCLIFLLLGWAGGFAVVYFAMFVASAVYLALALVRWYAQMRTLDGEGLT